MTPLDLAYEEGIKLACREVGANYEKIASLLQLKNLLVKQSPTKK